MFAQIKMAKLYVYQKKGEDYSIPLKKDRISIGRSADNDINVVDPFCSGHHAYIYPSDEGWAVRDNASKNGTFLNGKKIKAEVELKKGDEVLVGSTRIVFDKEISTHVEVTETPTSSANVNTIMQVEELLTKTEINTTMKASLEPVDLEKVRTEYRALSIMSEVSKALLLHQPLSELLDNIMDLICANNYKTNK